MDVRQIEFLTKLRVHDIFKKLRSQSLGLRRLKMGLQGMPQAIQVALLDLGEQTSVNLDNLARKLNSLQSSFMFTIVAPITLAKIGDPTIETDFVTWYEFEPLFDLLRHHDCFAQYRYVIGVTHLPMTEKAEDREKDRGAYFSLSDQDKVAVVSLNERVTIYNSPLKSIDQYLSYLILCELLIMLCKHDLIHTLNNFCLFDDCVDRPNFSGCIEQGKICERCHSHLKDYGLGQKLLADVFKVLKWCRTNSVSESIKKTALHPLTMLFLGFVFGWFSPLVDPQYYMVTSYLVIFFSLLGITSIFINEKNKTSKSPQ
jgi:hypothetical protein